VRGFQKNTRESRNPAAAQVFHFAGGTMRKSAVTVVALLIILGMAAGCSRSRSDQEISTDIKAKMFSDSALKATNLDVAVKDGEVTLHGELPSESARLNAYKMANETQGVKKVNDQMTVKFAEALPPAPDPAPRTAARPARRVVQHATAAPARNDVKTASAPAAADPQPPAQTASPAPPPAPEPPPPPQPKHVEIALGSELSIRMIDSVDSEVNHTGQIFKAALDAPIVVDNEVVVPTGTNVFVKLVTAKSAGRISGQSELGLELVRMEFQGKSYSLVSGQYSQKGTSRGKRTAAMAGGGAVLGTLIGAVAGGGKGAAIGAAVGAAAGTGATVATKGQQIKIPTETKLDFKLEAPVEVTYFPEKNQTHRRKP
jgi:hypothetical protein